MTCVAVAAQTGEKPFKGVFFNNENRVRIVLDLYEETVSVPDYDFFGKMNGYLGGNVYGVWFLTSHKVEGNKATLRFSDDRGADSQTVVLTALPDSTFSYEALEGNNIRKVVNRKLVKIPSTMVFRKR